MDQPFDLMFEYSPENEQKAREYLDGQMKLLGLDAIMIVGVQGQKTNILAGARKPKAKLLIGLLCQALLTTVDKIGGTRTQEATTNIRTETEEEQHGPRL